LIAGGNLHVETSAWDERELGENEAEIAIEQAVLRADTSVEKGLAYHAFLENFDFSKLFKPNGERLERTDLEQLVEALWQETNAPLLEKQKLVEILSIPVFSELYGKRLYKERQFLVSLPVKDTYAARADGKASTAPETEQTLFHNRPGC